MGSTLRRRGGAPAARAALAAATTASFAICAALLVLAAAAAESPDADSEWDAVSEYPGAERQGAILQALSLGLNFTNVSRNDCVWKKLQDSHDACPDGDVSVHLYTSPNTSRVVNVSEASSLQQGDWDAEKHTIVLVHGYGGGHDALPLSILRDAYLAADGYNVLVVDWSRLSRLPCYPAAVHNSVVAARCVGGVARLLRDSGARGDAWTCVGHSLGAHVCGIMADTVMFRVHKIIGLDPARPLIRPQNKHRLDSGDAAVVHVMHTNAGHYGELGAIGTADFCVNGGRAQPFCSAAKNPNLCSHLSSICFLADSVDGQSPLVAEPCGRRCPSARRHQTDSSKQRPGLPASLGQHTPDSASGTFCASSADEPYCQREPGGRGHPRCCPPRHHLETTTTTTTSTTPAAPETTEVGPTTASTVGTEAATAAPAATTTSSYKVGAALPTTTTERVPETTAAPPPQPGFSPVTAPVRADHPLALDQMVTPSQQSPAPEASVPAATQAPVQDAAASTPVKFPAHPEEPVGMLPPPMPLPDWRPVMFVDDAAEAAAPPADTVQARPSEPLLRPPSEQRPPVVDPTRAATAASDKVTPPGRWTPPQALVPERWTPPPITVPSEPVKTSAAPASAPVGPVRWPAAALPNVHIVMPSNDTSLYTEEAVTAESPVFAVYSTRSPLAPPTRPLVLVVANSDQQQQQQQGPQPLPPQRPPPPRQHQHDISDNLVEPSTPYAEVTLSPSGFDQTMVAMMEMTPPSPAPVLVSGFPSPSPPPPEPAVPEEPGMIPAAGSPSGAWLPMVMLPPMPFAVDSWALRYKDRLPRPSSVRRTSFRKKVYD